MKLSIPTNYNSEKGAFQWTEGFAKFFIKDACNYTSKDGNESIRLTLKLEDLSGNKTSTFVYLSNKTLRLVDQLYKQIGLEDKFRDGSELESYVFLNKEGVCYTKLKKNEDGSQNDYSVMVSNFKKPDFDIDNFKDDDLPF